MQCNQSKLFISWLISLYLISISCTAKASTCDVLSSAGSVDATLEILTRPVGISPETVYFSAQQSADPNCLDFSGGSDIEACRTG